MARLRLAVREIRIRFCTCPKVSPRKEDAPDGHTSSGPTAPPSTSSNISLDIQTPKSALASVLIKGYTSLLAPRKSDVK